MRGCLSPIRLEDQDHDLAFGPVGVQQGILEDSQLAFATDER